MAPFEITAEIEIWKAKGRDLVEPEGESCYRQRSWVTRLVEYQQKILLNDADQFSRARLLASAQSESGS